MRTALNINKLNTVYNKTARYYDFYHRIGTFGLDEKGRNYLIQHLVKENDFILDAGGGTGRSSFLSLKLTRGHAKAVVLDQSELMLEKGREIAKKAGLSDKIEFINADMYSIPFNDNTFDKVISTYSTCPLDNPANAVIEMLRVLKPGGLLGIAHSTNPENKITRWISTKFENLLWKFPRLSLGCRNIELVSDIQKLNVSIETNKTIGFIPFYFKILIIRKP
ncbi:MAG: class I SAM-dependent methyltransferase [Chlorobi bacterium]|nr:class I SAM-dependent methyltransferase [Chlorobiota bacterium]